MEGLKFQPYEQSILPLVLNYPDAQKDPDWTSHNCCLTIRCFFMA